MCTCGEEHKITRTLGPGYVKVNIQLYDPDKPIQSPCSPSDMGIHPCYTVAHVYRYQSDLRVFVLKHNTQDVQVISKCDSEQTKLQQVHRYHAVLLINREWFCSHTDNTACSCNFSAFLKQRKGSDRLFIW